MFPNKSIYFWIVFVTLVELSSCGIGRMPSPIHPDHPNKCYYEKTDRVISIGSRYRVPTECAQVVCEPDLTFKITTCAPYGLSDPSCREIKPNIRLSYPRCCKMYECTDGQGGWVLV